MSKHERTLEQIRSLNGNIDWKLVEALLVHLGAEVHESKGSAVTFKLHNVPLTVHRPHPRRHRGAGLVKRVRRYLETVGEL